MAQAVNGLPSTVEGAYLVSFIAKIFLLSHLLALESYTYVRTFQMYVVIAVVGLKLIGYITESYAMKTFLISFFYLWIIRICSWSCMCKDLNTKFLIYSSSMHIRN